MPLDLEARLPEIVRIISVRTGRPASTTAITLELGCYSRRAVLYHLAHLERHGDIARLTRNTGWLLADEATRIQERGSDAAALSDWLKDHYGWRKGTIRSYLKTIAVS